MEVPRPTGVRHVWVRPPLGRSGARPGVVITWRRVQKGAAQPTWQAYVLVVDPRFETTTGDWFYATELVPVRSDPPA